MDKTCNFNYGYYAYVIDNSSQVKSIPITVIKKGTNLNVLKTPVWSVRPINVFQQNKSGTISVFMNDGESDTLTILLTNHSIERLFPNVEDYKNYFVGFSLDENQVPTICVKSENDEEAVSTSLLEYFNKI